MLPSGFAVYGAGKGAVCISCHNSRNGAASANVTDANGAVTGINITTWLHEDSEPKLATYLTGYSAPHQACQGDVVAGRNAFFLGAQTPMTSKHTAVEDICVGCHMVNNPATHLSHGAAAVNTHAFRIYDKDVQTLCGNCHGKAVNGEAIQAYVETSLTNISNKMGAALKAKIGSAPFNVVAWDAASDLYTLAIGGKNPSSLTPLVIDPVANPIVSVGLVEVHGQIGFQFTFTSNVTLQLVDATTGALKSTIQTKTFAAQMGTVKDTQATPVALYPANSNMTKAGWNYFLLEGDQSKGLHNPTFAETVIAATMAATL
jgi:formate-dependent nitrite reductase cytochrome c552 subunit